jgi:hypothetical protein
MGVEEGEQNHDNTLHVVENGDPTVLHKYMGMEEGVQNQDNTLHVDEQVSEQGT